MDTNARRRQRGGGAFSRGPKWAVAGAVALIVLAAAALVAFLAFPSKRPSRPTAPPPAFRPPSLPTPGTGAFVQAGGWPGARAYNSYAYVIVGTEFAARAAHVLGRSLVYFASVDVNTNWNAGVSYRQAVAHGWLLRDSSGNLLVNKGYPNNYVGDVGSPAYQQAWLRNVLAFLRSHGDDGVFIDDVLRDLLPLAGSEAAKYPTQQAWAAAQLSFVRAVGPALRAHGYYVLLNASGYIPGNDASNDGSSTNEWWRQLAPSVSGMLNEYYQELPDGSNRLRSNGGEWTQNWARWQRLITTAQSLGKDFVGLTYGPSDDTTRMSYGKASFLLDWNGGGGAFIYQPDDDHDANPWNPAWTADIGHPTAAKQQIGTGWLRRYSDGVALLNPDPSNSQTFQLGGDYLTPDGHTVNQITLQPTTGLILSSHVPARVSASAKPPASLPPGARP